VGGSGIRRNGCALETSTRCTGNTKYELRQIQPCLRNVGCTYFYVHICPVSVCARDLSRTDIVGKNGQSIRTSRLLSYISSSPTSYALAYSNYRCDPSNAIISALLGYCSPSRFKAFQNQPKCPAKTFLRTQPIFPIAFIIFHPRLSLFIFLSVNTFSNASRE
jgi:hypothetical protein